MKTITIKVTYAREYLNKEIQSSWQRNNCSLQHTFNLTNRQLAIIASNKREYNELECDEEGATPEQEKAMYDFTESVIDELNIDNDEYFRERKEYIREKKEYISYLQDRARREENEEIWLKVNLGNHVGYGDWDAYDIKIEFEAEKNYEISEISMSTGNCNAEDPEDFWPDDIRYLILRELEQELYYNNYI